MTELRVLFVCGSDLRGPSEKQALWFSSELVRQGHKAMISLGDDPGSLASEYGRGPEDIGLRWRRFTGPRLSREDLTAAREFRPDLVHAFSSRVPVIAAARQYGRAAAAPVFVHWEDDEWSLMRAPSIVSKRRRAVRHIRRLASVAYPPAWYLSTSRSIRWTTRNARSFDAIGPGVAEYVSEKTGRECEVILPPNPPAGDSTDERDWQLPLPGRIEGVPLVGYTGQIHPERVGDLRLCLEGVAEVQRRGISIGFVHAGGNTARADTQAMAREAGIYRETATFLGHLPFTAIPALLRRCAVLLQVGFPTPINLRSLPSKLQAYLASGTPTIVSASGSGQLLEDRREALKVQTTEPSELADRIVEVLQNAELRQRLSTGGPDAAKRLFDPERNTRLLVAHYARHLDGFPV